MTKNEKVTFVINTLNELYPEIPIPLDHKDPYTLLIAVLLSAQCTDVRVNQITPLLFAKADNPYDMIKMSVEEIKEIIRPCGLSPMKSKGIHGLSHILIDKHNYSESSSILNFYTLEKGYASFIFKGVKKKGKSLNQLGLYEISYFKRPESELGIIQTMDYAWTPSNLYTQPQKVMLVFFMADVLKQTIKQQGPDPQLFEYVQAQLIDLETRTDDFIFPTQFLAQYMQFLGYAPLFDEEDASAFDIERGMFTNTPSGSKYVQDPAVLSFLKAQFFKDTTESYPKDVVRKGLEVLVNYAELHLPNFSLKVTMEVIRDTLYA